MEYCRYGNLRHYLLKKRNDFIDTMDDAVKQKAAAAAAKEKEAQMVQIPPPSPPPRSTADVTDYTAMESNISSAPTDITYMDAGASTVGYSRSPSRNSAMATGSASVKNTYSEDDELPLTTKDLVCFCFQVSRGMEYLASKKVCRGSL